MCVIYNIIILNIYRMGLGKEMERAEIVEYSVGRDRWIEISARFREV